MDINDLQQLRRLWQGVYPYLIAQIMESYQMNYGSVLELGPFSGGISLELARLYPKFKITIADESPDVVAYLEKEIPASAPSLNIEIKKMELNRLAFDNSQFDIVVFRGAFFFLGKKENLLREIFRVLRDGGMGFIGGGYGKGAPQEMIDEIADESRELNKRLGRRWVSIEELTGIVRRSQLTGNCRIVEEGGVWLLIKK
jgi:ubiquinone/menaquinone biosynthesis C-methylase UbiE